MTQTGPPLDAAAPGDQGPAWQLNRDVAWDDFNPQAYYLHNYKYLRDDDRFILNAVAPFLARHFLPSAPADGEVTAVRRRGIDVGSGANLYPGMLMLPWCQTVTLSDHSSANCQWLRNALAAPERAWENFWVEIAQYPGYDRLTPSEALAKLKERATVEQSSVFELPEQHFDVGTMFFVAESMTSHEAEFEDATRCFLGSLVDGAPFAAAFMDSSLGYEVGAHEYPAVGAVNLPLIEETLNGLGCTSRSAVKVPIPAHDPLRNGYQGMIVTVGVTRH